VFTTTFAQLAAQSKQKRKGRDAGEMVLLGELHKWDHGTSKKTAAYTASIHSGNRETWRKGEIWSVFFGRIRTSREKKRVWRKTTHTSTREGETNKQAQKREREKEREKKKDWLKLMTKKKKSITYYIKSIFSR
jgi:hypothetical protein